MTSDNSVLGAAVQWLRQQMPGNFCNSPPTSIL